MSSGPKSARFPSHLLAIKQTSGFVRAGLNTETFGAPETSAIVSDRRMGLAVMEAVSDEPSHKILGSIISRGRSISEICSETGVPLSTAYRRVQEMADEGVIVLERVVLTESGRRHAIYRSAFSKVAIEFTSGGLRVTGTPNNGATDIAYKLGL